MNRTTLKRLLEDLAEIKRTMVRYRRGEITATSPLAVKVGGSPVPYSDVRAVTADLDIGDQVAVLMFGNDLIVLGRIVG